MVAALSLVSQELRTGAGKLEFGAGIERGWACGPFGLLSIPFADVLYSKEAVRGILSGNSGRLSIVSYQSQSDLPYTF